MKYEDLPKAWLEARGKPVRGVTADTTYPAYSMKPEDINIFLNDFEAYDLYNKPNKMVPQKMDYETSTVNPDGWGALFAEGEARPIDMVRPMTKEQANSAYRDVPEWMRKFIPQAIYTHEKAHFDDTRINTDVGAPYPFNSDARYEPYLNEYKKKLLAQGKSEADAERIARREAPAMAAEDMFWGEQRRQHGI